MEPFFLPAHINLHFYLFPSDLSDIVSFRLTPSHFLYMSCGKVAPALQSTSQIPDTHACIFYCAHMLLNSLHDYCFTAEQMGSCIAVKQMRLSNRLFYQQSVADKNHFNERN